METRCKFTCSEPTEREGWNGHKTLFAAKFRPVYGNSEENKKFFEATPSGLLEIGCFAKKSFEVGKEYYLDISEAPVQAAP